ncbi:MAG: sporulation protein YqfD [Christensenellales bacterium]|jgi:similar to stage IV sporulation protein
MALSLWYSLRGYVKIQVKGSAPIRLIELARASGIPVRGIRSEGPGVLTACVTPKGFFMLRGINRQAKCSVRILKRSGVPFLFAGLRSRPMLFWGGVAALTVLYLLSGFIWRIDVSGCLNTDEQQVIEALKDEGVTEGTPVKSIDHSGLGDRLILRTKGLAWVGVTIEGTRLLVEVVEETPPPEALDDSTPADIVATKKAMIASIFVYEGVAQVQEGQTVNPGQLLVSGALPHAEGQFVRARADIVGRVWYTGRAFVSDETSEFVRTGRVQEATVIEIAGMEAAEPPKFAQYDTERSVTYDGSGFFLPMTVSREIRREIKSSIVMRREDELMRLAKEASFHRATAQIPKDARIVASETTFQKTEQGMIAITVVETNENISAASPIPAG